jgi:2,4-dienoyl-CoA reductase-like NADH-dependent reductase (Old Yellow Enzyme family)
MTFEYTALFQPFAFDNGLTLRNRVVMAPMTTWSANPDGTISDSELDYYRRRAQGEGCAEFCINGQSTAGESLLVRKHNDNQEARSSARAAGQPAGRLQEA